MNSLQIDTNVTFCPVNLVVSQPLSITNTSQDQLAFKIKTNQKNLLSMHINHGFIKPFSTISIPVKIVQKVDDSTSIKLEVNWCIATPQIKKQNDSKMSSVAKDKIFKKVFPINRKIQGTQSQISTNHPSYLSQQKTTTIYDSVYSTGSVDRQQKKITPFQYQKQKIQSSPKQILSTPKKSDLNLQLEQQDSYVAEKWAQKQDTMATSVVGAKNLQTVSQQDQQDHEKELQQIRNLQIQQRRKIDEIKVKIRKLNQTIKSNEIISHKLLAAAITTSFLFGGFLQYLIF